MNRIAFSKEDSYDSQSKLSLLTYINKQRELKKKPLGLELDEEKEEKKQYNFDISHSSDDD